MQSSTAITNNTHHVEDRSRSRTFAWPYLCPPQGHLPCNVPARLRPPRPAVAQSISRPAPRGHS
eukprot:6628896-Alexandrium_andersonii.AAC.1